jgi:cytochrome c oxidase subunit 2
MMLFNVKVVSQEDYDAHMAELAAQGNVGQLTSDPNDPNNLNRNNNLPGDNPESEG